VTDTQTLLDALSSPVRREILWLIWRDELPAGAIAAAVQLSPPTVSEHLAVLRDAGLVSVRASGTFRHYRAERSRLRALQSSVLEESSRWTPADDLPERSGAMAMLGSVVTARAEVNANSRTVFEAFTDAAVYSAWLGVPVTIDGDRFSTTMEFGTSVRGHYDVVVPHDLIALRWDFADDGVPLPGGEMVGYVRFHEGAVRGASTVTVHQLVESGQQAEFMEVAWTMVLGRLRDYFAAPAPTPVRRAARPKRRLPTDSTG
jgi:DNA-binding transcriptional ArsR family regulator/uncharacterized protein YndB with AHSA1/START domain